ncbi:uncharacterized protein LOC123527690 isoform X2 [Mercenaria mercenaria]|uniref:uncharacterized protein LOC123527690 isoform X2 n=1 Tax=Mercenaria mercenaria TaxID=6596 RepID=UPI00234F4352|nr:uncharacterized protein LOC123527690 isoform X2 [Mercenaria mercenaria]
MDHKAQLENKKYRNWVRAGLGIKYVKEGLEPFCDHLVNQQHIAILDEVKRKHNLSAVSCGLCDISTLQPDHVQTKTRQCPLGQSHCNCLHTRGKTLCPSNVCGAIYDEIITRHASTPPAPYWRNTDAHQWCTDPWAVAKCFINAPGYDDKIRVVEFDCSGLLHLLINNLEFHQHIQCVISGNDAFSRVLQHRNTIFHSNNMELEDNDFALYVDDMIKLLEDDKEIKGRPESKEAVKKLLELKQEKFIITTTDESEVRCIAMAAINEKEKNLEQKIVDATEDIGVKTDESEQQIRKIGLTVKDELTQKGVEMKVDLRKTEIDLIGRLEQREKEIMEAQRIREVESTKTMDQKEIECKENLRMTEVDLKLKLKQKELKIKENLRVTEVNSKEGLKHEEIEIKQNLKVIEEKSKGRLDEKGKEIEKHLERKGQDILYELEQKQSTQIQIEARGSEDISKEAAEDLMKSGPRCTPVQSTYERKKAAVTKLYMDGSERDEVYVATNAHENAKKILNSTGCLILSGPPGEGKTMMAIKLTTETTRKDSCLKLGMPSDWDHIDLSQGIFKTIFIDDIFGAGALDDKLLEGWSQRLRDIEKAIEAKVINVVITTRHYILKEAKEKLRQMTLFKDQNIQQLASFDLTGSERVAIIEKHLLKSHKELSSCRVENCSKAYERAFTFKQIQLKLPDDIDEYLQKNDSIKAMIGFPEIVTLFVRNEHLFQMGSFFFENPVLFFKKCMEELFIDGEKFLALILIWTRPNKELQLTKQNLTNEIKKTALKFGIHLKGKAVGALFKSLKYHEHGFLKFDRSAGTFSFTHNTVKDMVGLVAGQEYQDAVLEFADEQFLMQYITTDVTKQDSLHIVVDEYQFPKLFKAICKVMKQEKLEQYLFIAVKKRDFEIRNNFGRLPLGPPFVNELNINTSVLKHDCFENDVFVQLFCKRKEGRYFLSKPVDVLPKKCTIQNCDIDFGEHLPVYLPSLALLYKHTKPLKTFLKMKFPRPFKKAQFLRSTLVIASQQGMKDVIELLLLRGAVVCEDAIYFAAAKGHYDCLEYLLQNCDRKYIAYTNSINKSSPLIAAAKYGYVQCIKSLLRHGADVNYRNKNNWSALDKAILSLQFESCQILLENKAAVNYKTGKFKRTPLHMNADIGGQQITKLLLQYGASITTKDYRGHNPIHCAAFRDHTGIVEILLKADVSQVTVKRRVSYGRNSVIRGADLFHIAVFTNNEMLVDILLKNIVSPNVRDFYGQTPLHRAICACKQDKFDLLLKYKNNSYCSIIKKLLPVSDVRQADRHGYTPLHAAVHKGLTDIVKLLCPLVDVNARDKYGKTPLHTACEQLDLDIFKILIDDYRADYRMRTKTGLSIFDILEKKTSSKSIRRRYRDRKPVEEHMIEKPQYESFRKIVAAKDPDFAKLNAKPLSDAHSQQLD